MTRVDFYLNDNPQPAANLRTACQVADKAYRLGHRVYLYTPDASTTAQLDDLLWTFSAGAFVPHCCDGGDEGTSPVIIGHTEPPAAEHDVLISVANRVPEFFTRFTRLAEIVSANADDRASARERFRYYRERGYPLETHNLAR
jgi:DNA polymerase-3 subunit chi